MFHMYTLELHPTYLRMTAPDNDCCTHVALHSRELPLASISAVTLSSNDMLAAYGLDQLNVWTASNTEESGPELAVAWLAQPLQAREAILNAIHRLPHEDGSGDGGGIGPTATTAPLQQQQLQQQRPRGLHAAAAAAAAAAASDAMAARAPAYPAGLGGAVVSAAAAGAAAAAAERPKLGWSSKGGVGGTSQHSDRDRDSGGSSSMLSHSSSDVAAAAATSELASFYLQRSLREMALQPPAQQQPMSAAAAAASVSETAEVADGLQGQALMHAHQNPVSGVPWPLPLPLPPPPQQQQLDVHVHHYHHHHHLLHLPQQHHHMQPGRRQQQQLHRLDPAGILAAEQQALLEHMAAAGAEQALGAAEAAALVHVHMTPALSRAKMHIAPPPQHYQHQYHQYQHQQHEQERYAAAPLPRLPPGAPQPPPRLLPSALHLQQVHHHAHDCHSYHASAAVAAAPAAAAAAAATAAEAAVPPQAAAGDCYRGITPQLLQRLQRQQREEPEHDPELFGAAALGLSLRPLRVPPRRPIWPTGRVPQLKTHKRASAAAGAPAGAAAGSSGALPAAPLAPPPQAMAFAWLSGAAASPACAEEEDL